MQALGFISKIINQRNKTKNKQLITVMLGTCKSKPKPDTICSWPVLSVKTKNELKA